MINVNMTPNPYDIQTLHCSQGDDGREFEIKLHNNGEVIDTSNVKEPIVYPVFKGGTEQILPVNGSVPVTSPLKAQIQYPDGVRDVEFTYQQTPSQEDGQAKIKSIKGNTIKWNQLVQNGNFADSSNWSVVSSAVINSITNNIINVTTASSANSGISQANIPMVNGHKYLLIGTIKTTGQTYISISGVGSVLFNTNSFATKSNIFTWTSNSGNWSVMIRNWDANSATFEAKNIMLIDLTQLGQDLSYNDFVSLFPLPYYQYNQGELISFNGTGIKTTNKNFVTNFLADSATSNISFVQTDGVIRCTGLSNGTTRTPTFTDTIPMRKGTYILSGSAGGSTNSHALYVQSDITGTWSAIVYSYDEPVTFTLEQDCNIRLRGRFSNAQTTNYDVTFYPMVTYADVSDQTFEPYHEHITNLPISTYFPTGMKSIIGTDVYDEMTESKASARVLEVDMGTIENWYQNTSENFWDTDVIPNLKSATRKIVASKYDVNYTDRISWFISGTSKIRLYASGATTVDQVKALANGVMLYCELATPTETSITTASLVSEYGEIPLKADDDHLVAECTSELSSEAGFHDLKVKLSDEDGDVYSNRIQLHVERRP